jgi:signal transduction histidine kinase
MGGTWLASVALTMSPALVLPNIVEAPLAPLWSRMALAVHQFGDSTGVHAQWLMDTSGPWSPAEAQAELMLAVLEAALANAQEHGRAHQLTARVRATASDLSLLVRDDGRGAPPSAFLQTESGTLARLRARADAQGGWLQIDSQPGQGTQLILSLPVPFRFRPG